MKILGRTSNARQRRMSLEVPPHWVAFNPSITVWKGELVCSVRLSTQTVCDCGHWILQPNTRYQNEILLAFLDRDLNVTRQQPVPRLSPEFAKMPYDFEDMRLFVAPDGQLQGIGAYETDGEFRAITARVEFNADLALAHAVTYPSPLRAHLDKNWSPFLRGNELHAVYHWDPFQIIRLHEAGTTEFISQDGPPLALPEWRGSSPGVPVENGWLFVLHRRSFCRKGFIYRLDYTHRLVELGHDLSIQRISEEFRFVSDGIEYCAGLARLNDSYVFSFGKHDCQAHLLSLPIGEVEKLLKPFDPSQLPLRNATQGKPYEFFAAYRRRTVPPTLKSLGKELFFTLHHQLRCLPRLR